MRTGWAAILMGVSLVCAPIGSGAQQEDTERSQTRERRWGRRDAPDGDLANRTGLSAKTQERHADAIELLFEERYDDAEQELGKLYFNRLNVVEQATVHRDFAYIAIARGDTAEARRRLEAAIAVEDGLLPEERADARFQIAMLWMQEENWSEAAQTLETWLSEVANPNPRSYYILSLCYYQQGDFARALPAVQKAVDEADEPKEPWLQLLLALHLLDKKYEQGIPILERLISVYPRKGYFTSLSTIYGALGSFEDAAIPLQLAYDLELLTDDSDLRRLGQLLIYVNLPYRSGEILKQGLESDLITADSDVLAMLSNSWIAAREYDAAVEPLERAASLAPDGDLYMRLAQVHVQRERWGDAANALERSFEKGDLDDPADATLLMGIALYSKGDVTRARNWFRRAQEYEATRGEAGTWIRHIDQELAESQAAM